MTLTANDADLYTAYSLGPLRLPNRFVMAPMTRNRAGTGNVPTAVVARYYEQRASAGLLVTEATQVAPEGVGYPNTPGIHSIEQVAGWRRVTDAIHRAGGRSVSPALARRPYLASTLSTGRRLTGCTVRRSAGGSGVHGERDDAVRDSARSDIRRDPGNRRAVPPRSRQRSGGRIRRSRDPCREWYCPTSFFAMEPTDGATRPAVRSRIARGSCWTLSDR